MRGSLSVWLPFRKRSRSLMISLRLRAQSSMDFLHGCGARAQFLRSRYAMLDVVYVVMGLLFFAVMAGYAVACDRL